MAAPTLANVYNSAWDTTTTPKTLSVTTQAGDRVLVLASTADANGTLSTPTGNSLTYALAQSIEVSQYAPAYAWTATDAAGGSGWTLSCSRSGAVIPWGLICFVLRDSDGFGASSKTNVSSGAPSLALTTTQDNSLVAVINTDWNAADGTTRTWRTVNSFTPTAGNGAEKNYFRSSNDYTTYAAEYPDAGTAGSITTGLSAPGSQKYSIIAVEVKGSGAAPANPPKIPKLGQSSAVVRASVW